MNFLNKIYFDNTLGAWLMVSGIIALALLLKKICIQVHCFIIIQRGASDLENS